MFKEIIDVLYGGLIWRIWKLRFRANEKMIILVLVNENIKIDSYALAHLEDFMNRKYANRAVVVFDCKKTKQQIKIIPLPSGVKVYHSSRKIIERVYQYYSFFKCSDKLVFTYTNHPKDNQLGKVLYKTHINEEEAVCLGLYRLRKIPALKNKAQKLHKE